MHEVSHDTSAKRMTDVHAVLRCEPRLGRKARDTSAAERVRSAARCRNCRWLSGLDESAGVVCRTSREVLDVPALLPHPTAPHLAAFYLAIARSSVGSPPFLRGPSLNCDPKKIRPSTLAGGSAQVHCSRDAGSLVAARASRVARSSEARTQGCGGCAGSLQIGSRKATDRRVSVGRGNVGCCV